MIQKCLLLVSICCLTIGSTSFAQTEKGSLMVGGGFSLMYVNDVLDVTLQPEAGIFVADNFFVSCKIFYDIALQRNFSHIFIRQK